MVECDQDYIKDEDYNIKFFELSKYPELKPADGSISVRKRL